MDGNRFDELTRRLGTGASRRTAIKGLIGGAIAALGLRRGAEAQVSQAYCGNQICIDSPDSCREGCICCIFGNGNSRCTPPDQCPTCPGGQPLCKGECCAEGEVCTSLGCVPEDLISGTSTSLAASPVEIWAALTDAPTLTSLGISSDIAPRVGHRFQLRSASRNGFDGVMDAEVVEIAAPHRFAFKWLNGPLNEPTVVTFHLDPVADGTRTEVRLEHTDASGASCRAGARILGRDWGRRVFADALPRYLAEKRQL